MTARVALVTDNDDFLAAMRSVLEELDMKCVGPGTTAAGDATASAVMTQRPETVVLGPGLAEQHRASLTEDLDTKYPGTVVLWVGNEDAETWRAATKAGARDILCPSSSRDQIKAQLQRAIGIGDRRRSHVASPSTAELDLEPRARVITVVSPKGGSGKTMLSSSLAVGLQEHTDRGVVLVDLDLQFGDIAAALSLEPEYSIVDVVKSAGDATDMKAFLTAHPSGIYALPAPANPVEADDAEPGAISKLLDALSGEFGSVVVDTGAGIDEATLTAIEQSTDVVFITTCDVAAIQALRKAIVVLDRLHLDQHERWFVLNRSSSRTGLSAREIEEVTGLAIDAHVPSNRGVSKAMNAGVAVIEDQHRNKLGKSLRSIAALLAEPSDKRAGR